MLLSCRLSLDGGRPHVVVVDGGAAPRPGYLSALALTTKRVVILEMPEGHHDLDWLTPIADRVSELLVLGYGCKDLTALQHFTCLQSLTLVERPHPKSPPLTQTASTLRKYAGPWFPALDPVLASPVLRDLTLEQPPRDLTARLTAPLEHLRLLSARKLATVPVLACADTLTSLEIAGGRDLDLNGVSAYTVLSSLSLYGRTPLTTFADLTRSATLRRLLLEKCYAVDDIDALKQLSLAELRIVGRPESLDPYFLRTARELGVRKFSAPLGEPDGGADDRFLVSPDDRLPPAWGHPARRPDGRGRRPSQMGSPTGQRFVERTGALCARRKRRPVENLRSSKIATAASKRTTADKKMCSASPMTSRGGAMMSPTIATASAPMAPAKGRKPASCRATGSAAPARADGTCCRRSRLRTTSRRSRDR